MTDLTERLGSELQAFFGCTPRRAEIAAVALIEAIPELAIDDERSIYLAPDERKTAQSELNVFRSQALDKLSEMSRAATLEASLRTIQSSMVKYLKQEMTAEEFALEVIGAADNGKLNKTLEGK